MEEKEYCFESDLPKEIYDKKLPMFQKDDFVPETNGIKMSNPFLYNFKKDKSVVYSFEEFGLRYKKRNLYIGSFIRNDEISKNTKLRILRKYFRKCNRQARSKHSSVRKQIIKSSSKDIQDNIKITTRILIFVLLVLNLLILGFMSGKASDLFEIEYTSQLTNEINKLLSKEFVIIGLNLSTISIIFMILYMKLITVTIGNYNEDYKNHLTNSINQINYIFKIHKKEYSETRKHYINSIKKELNYYTTKNLEELWNLEYTYEDILDSQTIIEGRNVNVNRLCKINKVIQIGVISIITLANAFTLGIFIFVLLKSIFNKI